METPRERLKEPWVSIMIARNFPANGLRGSHTIVVCGIERGGTSMVAAALHHLGIYMGSDLDGTYEDHELATLIRSHFSQISPDVIPLKQAISRRNDAHLVWGFKVPNIFSWFPIFSLLRDPVLLFIFRDPIAISEGVSRNMNRDAIASLNAVRDLQRSLVDLFLDTPFPSIAFSYEKALAYPDEIINDLSSMFTIECSEDDRRAATWSIRPAPADYLRDAGAASVIGHLEGFNCGDLVGWVLALGNEERSLEVQIIIDGAVVDTVAATEERPDLWIYCKGRNFNHGFRWHVPRRYYDRHEHSFAINIPGSDSIRIGNQGQPFNVPAVFGALEGIVNKNMLQGWIYDWVNNTNETWLSLRIDGRPVAQVRAEHSREDLEQAGFTSARGFTFLIPSDLFDDEIHSVTATVENHPDAIIDNNPSRLMFPRPPLISF